jgi:hypothetical protein
LSAKTLFSEVLIELAMLENKGTREIVSDEIIRERKLNWEDIPAYRKYLQNMVLVSCWNGIGRSADMCNNLEEDDISALRIESGLSGLTQRNWNNEILPILDEMCHYKFIVFTLHHPGELNKATNIIRYLSAKMGSRFMVEEKFERVKHQIRQVE